LLALKTVLPSERANARFRKINVSNECEMCDSLATWFSNVIKTTSVALIIYWMQELSQ
jgi:hypothetical protein